MAKKLALRGPKMRGGKVPSAPIKAPARNVKGIGKMGQFEGGLTPTVINPKYGRSNGSLSSEILGRQGR
jgi:hypothetical protein